ncbi:MAG: patatin-like phospholipase family protein [Candidatus Aminicenantes bacterium]|nr:patatin-like phospholipase family protein [Candidatus Aminicenantes bacterium]
MEGRKKYFLIALSLLLLAPSGRSAERPKVGLVLSGGGAKGAAHIPVLKLLDELEFPVDCIAGTSAGGIMGGLYAAGYSGAEIEGIFNAADWNDLFSDRPPRDLQPFFEKRLDGRYQLEFPLRKGIPSTPAGLISGQKFFDLFFSLTFPLAADIDFDELPIPFRCLAVDIVSGRLVILKKGSLARALRATMAIPTLLAPIEWDEFLLVDGGVLNNLPVDVIKDMGADIVIAVDLAGPLSSREDLATAEKILAQTLQSVELEQKKDKLEKVDVLIRPDMKGLSSADYFSPDKMARIREQGEEAARKARPSLLALREKFGLVRRPRVHPKSDARDQKRLLGYTVITGNDKIPASFIVKLFGLKTGSWVNAAEIGLKVNALYALGYFETIQCDIFPGEGDTIDLQLTVRERPRANLRLGLHYNGYHNLVAAAGLYATNFPFPGLRLENELEVAGRTRLFSKISYPTETLDFPVYPLLYLEHRNVPTRLYGGDGQIIADYRDRSFSLGGGLGFLLRKTMNLEIAYEREWMNIRSQPAFFPRDPNLELKADLRKLQLQATIDTLDNLRLPENGLFLRALFEGSYESLGSATAYERAEAWADIYTTFREKNTLRLYGYWGTSRGNLPFYKRLNQGRPETFVGMGYDQLQGDTMKILRGEFRYRFTNFVHFKIMTNVALDFEQRGSEVARSPGALWGAGAGVVLNSPIGPLDLVFSLGSKGVSDPSTLQGAATLELGARF